MNSLLREWAAFDSEHVCYVVQPTAGGPFKVGNAVRMSKRLPGIQLGHPELLVVRALFSGGRETERHLHLLLHDYRLMGEWFHEDGVPLLCDFIRVDGRLLWGTPWTEEIYREPPPTRAQFVARMRQLLFSEGSLAALQQIVENPKHECYKDALRMLINHAEI